jgi:alpha-beta hydrolase superfamily lysophospholipase
VILMSVLPPIHRWDDVRQPRLAVHILHGLAEHGVRYARLAQELNNARVVVWAHDHRGHGVNPTPGVRGHFADEGGWRALVDDAWAVSDLMMKTFAGVPLVLFAHSMGSFIGQMLMAEHGGAYRGVVLTGTNGSPGANEAVARSIAGVQRLALGGRAPGLWLQEIILENTFNKQFAPNRTKSDWLSRDNDEVDKYNNDPLCGFALTAQAWLDFLEGKQSLGTDEHLRRIPTTLPIYVIAGSRDPVGEQSNGVQRLLDGFKRVGAHHVRFTFYDGARHELVNETNRAQVTTDLIGWLNTLTRA